MFDDLQQLVHAVPFTPFTIGLNSGQNFEVPTRDHIALSKFSAIVVNEDGLVDFLSYRHIARLTRRDSDVADFSEPTSEPPGSR